jgi:hypothetical protein
MDVREAPIISSRHPRPFYGAFAWAYDLLTDRPVAAECTEIAATLPLVACDAAARCSTPAVAPDAMPSS